MPDPTNYDNDPNREPSDAEKLMDTIQQLSEFFSGAWQSLSNVLPEDLAEDAFRHMLDSQQMQNEMQLEQMRLRTAQAYSARGTEAGQ